jgi:hypothetical protein
LLFFWEWDAADRRRWPFAISTAPAIPLPLLDARQYAELCSDEPPGERLPPLLLGKVWVEDFLQRLGRHLQADKLLLSLQLS